MNELNDTSNTQEDDKQGCNVFHCNNKIVKGTIISVTPTQTKETMNERGRQTFVFTSKRKKQGLF